MAGGAQDQRQGKAVGGVGPGLDLDHIDGDDLDDDDDDCDLDEDHIDLGVMML